MDYYRLNSCVATNISDSNKDVTVDQETAGTKLEQMTRGALLGARKSLLNFWPLLPAQKIPDNTDDKPVSKYRYTYIHISIHLAHPHFQKQKQK
jgi:hypothetical protein